MAPPIRAALRNPHLARLLVAYLTSVVAEWAVWIAALLYAFERGGGATATGFASLGLLVPGVFAAPLAGAAADGRRPNRVLAFAYGLEALALLATAAAAARHAPVVVVVAIAAVAVGAITFVRPAFSVVLPSVVTSTADLTAANVLTGYCDAMSVLVGPLMAAALLRAHGPDLVFIVSCALTTISATLTWTLRRLDPPPIDLDDETRTPPRKAAALASCALSLTKVPGGVELLAIHTGQNVLIGSLDLIYVVAGIELLHLGHSGPGALSAAFGAGCVVGGFAATRLVGREPLTPVVLGALGVCALAIVAFGISATVVMACIALPIAGAGRSTVDVTTRILVQRAAPQASLASAFATLEVLSSIGLAAGSVLTQILIATLGARAAIIGLAVFLVLLVGAAIPRLRRIDAAANAPVLAIRLLKVVPIFARLPSPAIEGIARTATDVMFAAGDSIVTEGETGEHFFAIASGEVEVTQQGHHLCFMHRGEGFGEIALLAHVPRVASVTAHTDTHVVAIDRAPFLTAVTGRDASAQAAWSIARAMYPAIGDAAAWEAPDHGN